MSVDVPCYNCVKTKGGPCCHDCWKKLTEDQQDDIKIEYNLKCSRGEYGLDAQCFCQIPTCWGIVRKKKAADGDYRCYEHLETDVTARSRSPVRRRSDAAARSSSDVTLPRDQVAGAIGRLRAGLEMMQNAIQDIDDAVVNH